MHARKTHGRTPASVACSMQHAATRSQAHSYHPHARTSPPPPVDTSWINGCMSEWRCSCGSRPPPPRALQRRPAAGERGQRVALQRRTAHGQVSTWRPEAASLIHPFIHPLNHLSSPARPSLHSILICTLMHPLHPHAPSDAPLLRPLIHGLLIWTYARGALPPLASGDTDTFFCPGLGRRRFPSGAGSGAGAWSSAHVPRQRATMLHVLIPPADIGTDLIHPSIQL